jgi:hypothetical protein
MNLNYILLLAFVFTTTFITAKLVSFVLQKLFPRYSKVIVNHKDGTKIEYMVEKGRSREIDNLIKQEHKRQFEENKKLFNLARAETAAIKQKIRNNCRNVV